MLNTFDYIKCYENSFWEWDLDDEYLHLKNGITFAHWEDIKEYVINLAPTGLPLFDVIAGIMAATMGDELSSVGLDIQGYLLPNYSSVELSPQLRILDTIDQVEEKYKRGSNRFLLVAAILEKTNVRLIDPTSRKIADDLGNSSLTFFGARGEVAKKHFKKITNCFAALNNYFPNPESIVEAMLGFDMTKIDLENIIPRTEESDEYTEGTLLEQLQNEPRTEKMAALIPYVISGMNFPINARQSDDRPDGGVSDLSNKGHFDQLIVSEFAYDDDYFLSRIVNNEALFYQREKAKNDNDDTICVMIDTSIYMWGLPKMIATAIACTIGMKEEKSDLECFLVGSELVPCNAGSIEGVLKATRFADAAISPAEGIGVFVETEEKYSNTLLVTTERSWTRPEMMRVREESKKLFDFVIFTNEDAEIKVLKSKGKQLVNFKLDVDTIWELKKKDVSSKSVPIPSVYPILFPLTNDGVKYFFSYNEELFFIDQSRFVFQVQKSKQENPYISGARRLMRIGPHLDVLGDIGLNKHGEFELLMFSRKNKQVYIYNLSLASEKCFDFVQWKKGWGIIFYHQNNNFYFSTPGGHIQLDDNFESNSEIVALDREMYGAALKRSRSIKSEHYYFHQKYFKKAKSADISDQQELVIRGKRIETSQELVHLYDLPVGSIAHRSTFTTSGERQIFTFNSGEKVISNPSGVVEFIFNEKNRPLGYELRLSGVGGNKLATVKAIRLYTGKGLKRCKEIVDTGAATLTVSFDENKLDKIAQELRHIGNAVKVRPLQLGKSFYMTSVMDMPTALASTTFFAGNRSFKDLEMAAAQRNLTPIEFHDLYINAFIRNIVNGV